MLTNTEILARPSFVFVDGFKEIRVKFVVDAEAEEVTFRALYVETDSCGAELRIEEFWGEVTFGAEDALNEACDIAYAAHARLSQCYGVDMVRGGASIQDAVDKALQAVGVAA